jgi:5-methylcytosine-specific restriction endonuclease McrA
MDSHIPYEYQGALENYSALILNADYRPLSYFPLSVLSWQDAIKAMVRDSVYVLSEHERIVKSPTTEFKLPSILVLKDYVDNQRPPAFTRFNVFLRDQWTCQYCGEVFKTHKLTFDHVIPRSKGGRTNWTNIVAACQCCNLKKSNKMPKECGMFPLKAPIEPTLRYLQAQGRKFPTQSLHQSWNDYLYWDTELGDTDEGRA